MSYLSNFISSSKSNSDDEYYTLLKDIDEELSHYKSFFVGKTIYCNCDNPVKSNFVQWFYMRFNILHLKRIIVTAYNSDACNGGGIIGIPSSLQWTQKLLISARKYQRMSENSTETGILEAMSVSSY